LSCGLIVFPEKINPDFQVMSKLISIVVPVYNTENYLERCVDSILQQSYTDVDVLLVNDGSTDACAAVCDRYARQDKRVRVFHQSNAGVAASRNKGLDNAVGEYISFIDSDDYIHPDMYKELYEELTKSSADLALFRNAVFVPEPDYEALPTDLLPIPLKLTGCHPAENFLREYLDTEPPFASMVMGKLSKRSIFDSRRFTVETLYSDTLFLTQWYLACEKITCIPENRYYYRQRSDGESFKRHKQWTSQRIRDFLDSRINKINLFYDHGLTDAAYSSDRFLIQGMLRYFESTLAWADSRERQRWLPELEKRWKWFNAQEWTIRSGKTYWIRNRREL
jgi:glycosyltransferase involved in cell wall biosynthesis